MTVSFIFGEVETAGFFEKRSEKQFRKLLCFVDGDVQCAWFDGLEYKVDFFKAGTLKKKDCDTARPILEEDDVVFLKSNPERLLSVSTVLGKTKLFGFEKRAVKKLSNFGFGDGDVQCMWVAGKEFQLAYIRAAMLVKTHIE